MMAVQSRRVGVPVLKTIVNQFINHSMMAVQGRREDRGIPVLKTIVNQTINQSINDGQPWG